MTAVRHAELHRCHSVAGGLATSKNAHPMDVRDGSEQHTTMPTRHNGRAHRQDTTGDNSMGHQTARTTHAHVSTPAGDRLRQERVAQGLSESDLMKRTVLNGQYVSQSQISNVERGRRKLSIPIATRLEDALGLKSGTLARLSPDWPDNVRSAGRDIPGLLCRLIGRSPEPLRLDLAGPIGLA